MTRKLHKIIAAVLVGVTLLVSSTITTSYAAANTMTLDNVSISDTGIVKVIGHITGLSASNPAMVTFLATDGSTVTSGTQIAYIDQLNTGNNGTFAFQFRLDQKWSNKTLTVKLGSNINVNAQTTLAVKSIPPRLANIVNNSVIYGADAYYLTNNDFLKADVAADNVADSIVYGGNLIYFKIGDHWYDLMDERCTSSAFLTKENALSYTFMENVNLRYYYYGSQKLTFAND